MRKYELRASISIALARHRASKELLEQKLWLATLVSNFGGLIQAVAASWFMTTIAASPDLVALVQASTTLPVMLFSLAAGALSAIRP